MSYLPKQELARKQQGQKQIIDKEGVIPSFCIESGGKSAECKVLSAEWEESGGKSAECKVLSAEWEES
ncbi:MAG: hypothetical protein LRZ84_26080, partial [Desertifilum sp.]|nr:hypothetical protein [Desertifilum sp.]